MGNGTSSRPKEISARNTGIFTVMPLGVEDVTLAANDTIIGKQYCGGIAAYAANGSQILRCANHGYVEGKSTHIGGICGNMAKSDITDCHNTGNITGTEKVGGIAGYTNGNSARYTHILRCFNSGQILASKAAGGICGNSYSCTEITQVYQNGQVWADTIRGSIVGLKSQKSVSFRYCYYDMQISPLGAINGTDDSTAAGLSTSALTDSLPSGFDSRYWQQAQGYCPIPVSAATDTAARIAATPVFPGVLSLCGAGCTRVTHPYATRHHRIATACCRPTCMY